MAEFVLSLILDLWLFGTAKLVLPLVSAGKWRVDIRNSGENWLSGLNGWKFSRLDENGIRYFGYQAAILWGVLIWVLLGVAVYWIF